MRGRAVLGSLWALALALPARKVATIAVVTACG
mgnify:CR=1 FL=1